MINTDPQPLSRTDRGGKIIANRTLKKLIVIIIETKFVKKMR